MFTTTIIALVATLACAVLVFCVVGLVLVAMNARAKTKQVVPILIAPTIANEKDNDTAPANQQQHESDIEDPHEIVSIGGNAGFELGDAQIIGRMVERQHARPNPLLVSPFCMFPLSPMSTNPGRRPFRQLAQFPLSIPAPIVWQQLPGSVHSVLDP